MINYSIIIPHKNIPQLLRRCLDSIPKRDDVQIVVVDDNSDEDKVDFNSFPGVDEPNTEVYLTKEGKGAGYARNVGLSKAVGKWVVFADADDYFHTEIFNEILDKCIESSSDVIFYKIDSVRLCDGTNGHRGDGFTDRVNTALKTDDFHPALMYSCPFGKVIRREFVENNHIHFNEVKCGNDVVFMAKIAFHSAAYSAVDSVGYCLTVNDYSITNNRSLENNIIRLQQDLEGAAFYKMKFELNEEDKFWYYVTWYNVYVHSKLIAFKYVSNMCEVIGVRCFINRWLSSAYSDFWARCRSIYV